MQRKTRLQHAEGLSTAPKMTYSCADGPDYFVMMLTVVGLSRVCFADSLLLQAWMCGSCVFLALFFLLHHGCSIACPLLFSNPVAALRAVKYHVQDVDPSFYARLAVVIMEHVFVANTPFLWHGSERISQFGHALWSVHFAACTIFRSRILAEHLWHQDHVRTFLKTSNFSRHVTTKRLFPLQIMQAYFTGIVCHLCLLMPWYATIMWRRQSVWLLPVNMAIDWYHRRYSRHNGLESYYREHWLGHHSRLHFLYLHGMHHDALPCALMATNDTGALEGFLRALNGTTVGPCRQTWYVPHELQFVHQTRAVLNDIILHQYIPSVYPYSRLIVARENHHVEHHYLALHPIGSAGGGGSEKWLVEEVDGYNADNKLWRWFVQAVKDAPAKDVCLAERLFWWLKLIPL